MYIRTTEAYKITNEPSAQDSEKQQQIASLQTVLAADAHKINFSTLYLLRIFA